MSAVVVGTIATAMRLVFIVSAYFVAALGVTSAATNVTVLRVPDAGIQPQAALDAAGAIHLIYFKGDPKAGDVFYVHTAPGRDEFSTPIRVNSQTDSVIAIGTIRGAQLALGKDGRAHVAWMGAANAEPRAPRNAAPMLYARLDDRRAAFEPQRNLIQFATGLDGGGSVAADGAGNVFVAWHADAGAKSEASRSVYVASSHDEGRTFGRERAVVATQTGACGCCGMRANADHDGNLFLFYRTATEGVNRDMHLLWSRDHGATFLGALVHPWKLESCPMSSCFLAPGAGAELVSWETNGQVYFAKSNHGTGRLTAPVAAPGDGGRRKHPVVAANTGGETLLAWTEGTGWNQGGAVAWQLFDALGQPTAQKGRADGVPPWSLAAVVARPGGGWTILY